MQEFLLYRPYRESLVIVFLCVAIAILSLCTGILVLGTSAMCFFFFGAAIELFFACCCYRRCNLIIAFGQYEIQVFNGKLLHRYLWNDFSEIYYAKNDRNRLYFVMSSEVLSEKQIKRLCYHGMRKHPQNALIFCADDLYYREAILNMIEKHQINVHK